MADKTTQILKVAAPPVLLAVLLALAVWWAYERFALLDGRLQAAEVELLGAKARIAELSSDSASLKAELVRVQRSNYDHEKMLATLFKIEKSGDSVVGFKRQKGQRSISVQVDR